MISRLILTLPLQSCIIGLDSLRWQTILIGRTTNVAQKSKTSGSKAKSSTSTTKVTRITATDAAPKAKTTKATTSSSTKKVVKKADETPKKTTEKRQGIIASIVEYFKGSWAELRQVRWPNRRTTWGLTIAVLIFTVFFVLLITVLDYAFQLLFKQILG